MIHKGRCRDIIKRKMNDLNETILRGRKRRKLLKITRISCVVWRRVPFDKLTSTDSSDDEYLLRNEKKVNSIY